MKIISLIYKLLFNILVIPFVYILKLLPRNSSIWVFGEWHGKSKKDNSHYLFNYIIEHEKSIQPIWITDSNISGKNIYKKNSFKGIYYSLRAKVVFITHDIDDVNFLWTSGAIIINLTHGIPLKKIGKDVGYKRFGILTSFFDKYIRDLLPSKKKPDYIFSGNSMSIKNFSTAYGVDVKKIFALGYPRWDGLDENIIQYNEKFILYAPTHRKNGNSTFDPFSINGFENFMKKCQKLGYKFIFKPHPSLNYIIPEEIVSKYDNFYCDSADTNHLLSLAEILITDYSSILYDYMILKRPVISLVHDIDSYINEDAGLYGDYVDLVPGPIFVDWNEIAGNIEFVKFSEDFFKSNYDFDYSNPCINIFNKTREII